MLSVITMKASLDRFLLITESPLLWLVLVIPATAGLLALQYPDHGIPRSVPGHASTVTAAPGRTRTDSVVVAAVTQTIHAVSATTSLSRSSQVPARETGVARDVERKITPVQAVTTPSVTSENSLTTPALAHMDRSTRADYGTSKPGEARIVAVLASAGKEPPSTSTIASDEDLSGPPVAAGSDTAYKDNPYLPVADDAAPPPVVAGSGTAPECPKVLFAGGNSFARLRLALMGCPIPGG